MRTAQEEARGHSQVLTESAGAKTQDVLVADTVSFANRCAGIKRISLYLT